MSHRSCSSTPGTREWTVASHTSLLINKQFLINQSRSVLFNNRYSRLRLCDCEIIFLLWRQQTRNSVLFSAHHDTRSHGWKQPILQSRRRTHEASGEARDQEAERIQEVVQWTRQWWGGEWLSWLRTLSSCRSVMWVQTSKLNSSWYLILTAADQLQPTLGAKLCSVFEAIFNFSQ